MFPHSSSANFSCEFSVNFIFPLSPSAAVFDKLLAVWYVNIQYIVKGAVNGAPSVPVRISMNEFPDRPETSVSSEYIRETAPCGLLACKSEDGGHPKITYFNGSMLHILGAESPDDAEELLGNDVFLIIAPEERLRFSEALRRAQTERVCGSIGVMRSDGQKIRLFGWISSGEDGEIRCMCADVTESCNELRSMETARYIKVLQEVYDEIFEYSSRSGTIQCLFDRTDSAFGSLKRVPMQFEQAAEQFVRSFVIEEDCEEVRRFIMLAKSRAESPEPPRITFRALAQGGGVKSYEAVLLRLDEDMAMLCFRAAAVSSLGAYMRSSGESGKPLVAHMNDGLVAFEVEDVKIRPLYASDNVCGFFGYDKSEWLDITQSGSPLKEFVSKSGIGYSEFIKVLDKGEAEFEYTDTAKKVTRRIKAVCPTPPRTKSGQTRRYVILYNVGEKNVAALPEKHRVYIRTFGYFDVFIDKKPIAFRNEKSKELFALLVNRRGGYVSSEEAISFLWENEPVSSVTLARYRKVALRLKNILEEYGISDIVESVSGKRRIATEKVSCDLYDYLSGKEGSKQLFKGSYLTNYSWGETTLAELMN